MMGRDHLRRLGAWAKARTDTANNETSAQPMMKVPSMVYLLPGVADGAFPLAYRLVESRPALRRGPDMLRCCPASPCGVRANLKLLFSLESSPPGTDLPAQTLHTSPRGDWRGCG